MKGLKKYLRGIRRFLKLNRMYYTESQLGVINGVVKRMFNSTGIGVSCEVRCSDSEFNVLKYEISFRDGKTINIRIEFVGGDVFLYFEGTDIKSYSDLVDILGSSFHIFRGFKEEIINCFESLNLD